MPGLLSLDRALISKISERTASAYLIPLLADGTFGGDQFRFQYYPEAISDTKGINWTPREIPGGSLPIYQWVSSGERVISFTTYFTTDMDLINADGGGADLVGRLKSIGQDWRNVDIRSAVAWLRQFMFPTYGTSETLGVPTAKAPSKLYLKLTNSGIGFWGGGPQTNWPDAIACVMTQCDVTIESLFPTGLPRIVSVSLSFSQVPQMGSAVNLPTAELPQKAGAGDATTKTAGYFLPVRAPTIKST